MNIATVRYLCLVGALSWTASAAADGRSYSADEVYSGAAAAQEAAVTGAKAPWYKDAGAGFRFRVPIPGGEVKTAQQVQALILERPGVALPDGAAVSGGIFSRNGATAASGVPFLVVFTLPESPSLTRSDLTDLMDLPQQALKELYGFDGMTFERDKLRGYGTLRLGGGLKARALIQIARGESLAFALYYVNDADGDLLDRVAATLELAPDRRLTWTQLPRGNAYSLRLAAAASVLLAGLGIGWTHLRGKAWRPPKGTPASPAKPQPAIPS